MVTIGVLGSHSAEEVSVSAKKYGFKTVVVCKKGREEYYTKHNAFLYDHALVLDEFSDILHEENQQALFDLDTVWMPNRSFSAYIPPIRIETEFRVPVYGNKYLLKIEERTLQYDLLDKAGIRRPCEYTPDTIDRLVIVKTQQKNNPLERAFFFAHNPKDYYQKSKELIKNNTIDARELNRAVIEEFIVGPRFNANYHAWAKGGFDFTGFDDRIQDNLSGLLNLPAQEQQGLGIPQTNEEVGHKGVTMRESKKIQVYTACEHFLLAAQTHYSPGMIGSFSLQGALSNNEFIVFDVSPRIPGSPCVGPTSPEMRRLSLKYNTHIASPLDLSMIDIARTQNIEDITT